MTCSCEHGNETSSSINDRKVLEEVSDCQHPEKNCERTGWHIVVTIWISIPKGAQFESRPGTQLN
jgi:hypothetical protein